MKRVLFLLGPPGVGKTTLARLLLGTEKWVLTHKPKWTVTGDVCAAGTYNGGKFDGADMVPYNGAKEALLFWERYLMEKTVTMFDGDRFSNATTLTWLKEHAPQHVVLGVHLLLGEETLTKRREERGSTQNAAWMKGRATKAARFAALLPRMLEVDAELPPEHLASTIRSWI